MLFDRTEVKFSNWPFRVKMHTYVSICLDARNMMVFRFFYLPKKVICKNVDLAKKQRRSQRGAGASEPWPPKAQKGANMSFARPPKHYVGRFYTTRVRRPKHDGVFGPVGHKKAVVF